jgi:predicted DNA-binding transcriptional regulator YafY
VERVRAGRLVSILLLLQARGRMTAAALADELEVSVRTVYRDLVDLGAAGVPVYGERGDGGGYRLVDGYRTNLTGLTAEEAETLLLAGAAGPLAELGLGTLLATTRMKLLAAVPPALRPVATRAEQRFHLDPAGWAHAPANDPRHLRTVAGAVWRDHRLSLRYRRGDGRSVRRLVDPLGLVHKTGTWYLVAAAGNRPRVYRVDRVQGAGEVDEPVHRPDGFDLASFWQKWEEAYAAGLPTFTVRVRLGPVGQRHQGSMGPLSPRSATDPVPDGHGWATQTLTFDDRRVALAALQALAPDVEVLDPLDLRGDLVANARALADRNPPPTRPPRPRSGTGQAPANAPPG